MLLLYRAVREWRDSCWWHLHSIMLLLYLFSVPIPALGILHLHSIMLLLYLWLRSSWRRVWLWFTFHYASTLSVFVGSDESNIKIFTFHYASTLSRKAQAVFGTTIEFTFHYASTLSGTDSDDILVDGFIYIPLCFYFINSQESPADQAHPYLHSIMLLLYLSAIQRKLGCAVEFTFHYASTLSAQGAHSPRAVTVFTFHYASTLS